MYDDDINFELATSSIGWLPGGRKMRTIDVREEADNDEEVKFIFDDSNDRLVFEPDTLDNDEGVVFFEPYDDGRIPLVELEHIDNFIKALEKCKELAK